MMFIHLRKRSEERESSWGARGIYTVALIMSGEISSTARIMQAARLEKECTHIEQECVLDQVLGGEKVDRNRKRGEGEI